MARELSMAAPEYRQFIEQLKGRVLSARISAARVVNGELILLYWDIGRGIVEKQQTLGWGESVVEMVATDLRQAFPGVKGFSARNVWDMRRFYEAYPGPELLGQAVPKTGHGAGNQILRQLVAESAVGKKRPQTAGKSNADAVSGDSLQQLAAVVRSVLPEERQTL